MVLRAANVSLINRGTIDQGFNEGTAQAMPLFIISKSSFGTPLAISFDNSGTLSATRVVGSGGPLGQRTDSFIQQYGAGTIEFSNTGLIQHTEINIQQQVGAGQDQVLDILNEGRRSAPGSAWRMRLRIPGLRSNSPASPSERSPSTRFFFYRATPEAPNGEARNVDFSLTNTGEIEQATLRFVLSRGTGMSATINNSGPVARGSEIRADAAGRNARSRVINSGALSGVLMTSFGRATARRLSSFLENNGTVIDSTFLGIKDFPRTARARPN